MSLIPDGEQAPAEQPQTPNEVTPPPTETPGTPNGEQPQTPPVEGEVPAYLVADGVPGEGEVPEWFKSDKYKTVSAQAEAYNELEGKFGSFTGAPEEGYKIEGMDLENSPLLKLTAEWGLEHQLSNDGLSTLIEKVNTLAAEQIEQDTVNAKEALGDNADKRLGDIAQWGKNNLNDDEYAQFQGLAQNAGQVEVIEKLIGMTKNSKLVTTPAHAPNAADAEDKLQDMQLAKNDKGQRLMDIDPAYRAKVNAKMKEFYKN